MIYYSLDIETTGLDPETCQILSIAMVREDTEQAHKYAVDDLPWIHVGISRDQIQGDPFAIHMNAELIKALIPPNRHMPHPWDVGGMHVYQDRIAAHPRAVNELCAWICDDGRINVAGKNVAGFDIPFLNKGGYNWLTDRFRHRVIDAGSVFVDWNAKTLPDLQTCKKMANIPGDVAHNALEDARDVIRVLRAKYAPNADKIRETIRTYGTEPMNYTPCGQFVNRYSEPCKCSICTAAKG